MNTRFLPERLEEQSLPWPRENAGEQAFGGRTRGQFGICGVYWSGQLDM